MTLDFTASSFYVSAYWYRRPESAASVADRYARYVDSLASISPLTVDWVACTERKGVPFSTARRNLVALVEKSLKPEDDGKIYPADGYTISAYTRRQPQNFEFMGFVGRDYRSPDLNRFSFETAMGTWPDLSLVTYPLFRSVALATIACWEPLYCNTQPSILQPFMAPKSWFTASWITYVHPSLVHRVTPPDIPVVEPTPDGGLLLAATTDTFSADIPAHLEAAQRIAAATGHLDDMMPPLL